YPSSTVTALARGACPTRRSSDLITSAAADSDGTVARLELFADSVKFGEKTNSPLTLTWTNAPKGAHVLKAVATDNRGATNTSALVRITERKTSRHVALSTPTNGA